MILRLVYVIKGADTLRCYVDVRVTTFQQILTYKNNDALPLDSIGKKNAYEDHTLENNEYIYIHDRVLAVNTQYLVV